MLGIGSLIGAGVNLFGGLFGGLSASNAINKYYKSAKSNIESQQAKNDNWYNRNYYQDATQRADAQALLTRTEESIRRRNKAAAGTQAVMGGTSESVAAAKAANNEALADAASRIVAANEARKDRIEEQYLNRDQQLKDKMQELEANKAFGKAQAVSTAVQGVASAASNIASAVDGWKDSKGANATAPAADTSGTMSVEIPEPVGGELMDVDPNKMNPNNIPYNYMA